MILKRKTISFSLFFFACICLTCSLCLQIPPGRGISRRGSKDQSDLTKGGLQNQSGKSTELPLLLNLMQSLVNIPLFYGIHTHTQSADLFLTCDNRKAKRVEHAGRNEAWVNSGVAKCLSYHLLLLNFSLQSLLDNMAIVWLISSFRPLCM